MMLRWICELPAAIVSESDLAEAVKKLGSRG